jgi:outer membrane protein assembly factor BamB
MALRIPVLALSLLLLGILPPEALGTFPSRDAPPPEETLEFPIEGRPSLPQFPDPRLPLRLHAHSAPALGLPAVAEALPAACPSSVTGKGFCLAWDDTYANPQGTGNWRDTDVFVAAAASADGSIAAMAGFSFDADTGLDAVTVIYDAFRGQRTWVQRYDGPGGGDDHAASVALSPDGSRVYVAGGSLEDSFDIVATAYDVRSGAMVWHARYDGPEGAGDDATSASLSPDGRTLYVAGVTGYGAGPGYNPVIVAFDAAAGEIRWSRSPAGLGGQPAIATAVASDATGVVAAGVGLGPSGSVDALAFEVGPEGRPQWVQRHDGPARGHDDAVGVALPAGASKAVIAGASQGAAGLETLTLAFERASGALAWEARHAAGAASDVANAITAWPDGSRVAIAGATVSLGPPPGPLVVGQVPSVPRYDALVLAYDAATGATAWARTLDGAGGYDAAYGIAATSDAILATGTSWGDRPLPRLPNQAPCGPCAPPIAFYDAVTWSVRPGDGAIQGSHRFDHGGAIGASEAGLAVAFSANGARAIVAGASLQCARCTSADQHWDALALAYDLQPAILGSAQFEPDGNKAMPAPALESLGRAAR